VNDVAAPAVNLTAGAPAAPEMHFLTVGTSARLVRELWDPIAVRAGFRISHLVHPTYDRASWDPSVTTNRVYFMREDMRMPMPAADRRLLESLERGDVPTIHNMIMSDRVVARLSYDEALSYATLLARRFLALFEQIAPGAIIGDFDALHSALGLGVARRLGIPWFALSFSTIPQGYVSCCTNLSPASQLLLEPRRAETLRARAEEVLAGFEQGRTRAPAYLPPPLLSPAALLGRLPAQLRSVRQVMKRRRAAPYRKYSDLRNSYTLRGMLQEAMRLRSNSWRLRRERLLTAPPAARYAFFGLHTQPEASIDVFAHFFSNQMRVIELLARSLPPTHALLVKLHKSDVPNYSPEYVARLSSFPGVQVVAPHASALEFIRGADLVFGIQGTIGLEAALLGKPVVMFGDSPVKVFPSVSTFGRTIDLPRLVRAKLAEPPPQRAAIVDALSAYLAPFYPASHNDWHVAPTAAQIDGYARFFRLLSEHVSAPAGAAHGVSA
jgi:Capsule polysaccharide biosynthesis protein